MMNVSDLLSANMKHVYALNAALAPGHHQCGCEFFEHSHKGRNSICISAAGSWCRKICIKSRFILFQNFLRLRWHACANSSWDSLRLYMMGLWNMLDEVMYCIESFELALESQSPRCWHAFFYIRINGRNYGLLFNTSSPTMGKSIDTKFFDLFFLRVCASTCWRGNLFNAKI